MAPDLASVAAARPPEKLAAGQPAAKSLFSGGWPEDPPPFFLMNKIRFGILGTGFMGRTHAEAIRRLDKIATVTAVWGGSRAPALAKDFNARLEPSMERLIQS